MSAAAPREKKEEIVKEEKENRSKKGKKNKQGIQEAERKQDKSHCHKECIPRSFKDNNSHRPQEG